MVWRWGTNKTFLLGSVSHVTKPGDLHSISGACMLGKKVSHSRLSSDLLMCTCACERIVRAHTHTFTHPERGGEEYGGV